MFNNLKLKNYGSRSKSGGEGVIVADRGCNDRHHYVSQIKEGVHLT